MNPLAYYGQTPKSYSAEWKADSSEHFSNTVKVTLIENEPTAR